MTYRPNYQDRREIVETRGHYVKFKGNDHWHQMVIGGPPRPLLHIGPGPQPEPPVLIGPKPGDSIDDKIIISEKLFRALRKKQ